MRLVIENLVKGFGVVRAVDDLSLEVQEGEFLVLLGPSGCGKTTTLRSVAGFEWPDGGRIRIGDQVVSDPARGILVPSERRNLGMVFQSYAIWPHMTVYENVAFGLEVRRRPKAETRERVQRTLELVGLGALAARPAGNLSGGQMQRVALARSLVIEPGVLLLDEPLSNLDAKLRERLRVELKEIQRKTGVTSVYVTHDQVEAAALGDRIAVINGGKLVQVGPPEELWRRPANRFVAEFLGGANIVPCEVLGRAGSNYWRCRVRPAVDLLASAPGDFDGQRSMYLALRPHDVRLGQADASGNGNGFEATIVGVDYLGTETRYAVEARGLRLAVIEAGTKARFRTGQTVSVSVSPDDLYLVRA